MTVAVAIEIGSGVRSEPEPGLASAKSANKISSAGGTGATAANSSQLSEVSFRSNWQSQLASLGSGLDSLNRDEETADGSPEALQTALEKSVAGEIPANSARMPGMALQLGPGTLQPGAPAAVLAGWSSRGAQADLGSAQNEVQVPGSGSSNTIGSTAATAKAKATAEKTAHDRSDKSQHTKSSNSNSTEPIVATLAGSSLPAMPVPIMGSAVPNFASLSLTALHDHLASDSSSGSYGAIGLATDVQAKNAENVEAQSGSSNHSMDGPHREGVATGAETTDGQTKLPTGPTPHSLASESDALSSVGALTGDDPLQPIGRTQASAAGPAEGVDPHAELSQAQQTGLKAQPETGAASLPVNGNAIGGDTFGSAVIDNNGVVAQTGPIPAEAQAPASARLAGGNSTSVQAASRSHGTGTAGNRSTAVQAQLSGGEADSTSIIRDPAAGRELSNPPDGSAGSAANPPLREAFAALDSGDTSGTLTWTHASAHQAEAGFEDPTLGWIGVRADRSGGGVHAALLPGSAEAAQELGTHMDGLNAYLAEQHTPVQSLAMAAPESRGANQGGEQNLNQGMNQGTGQGAGQGMNQGTNQGAGQNTPHQAYSEPESSSSVRMTGIERATAVNGGSIQANGQAAGPEASAHLQTGGGAHISVMA
jgi:hypothetical protein